MRRNSSLVLLITFVWRLDFVAQAESNVFVLLVVSIFLLGFTRKVKTHH